MVLVLVFRRNRIAAQWPETATEAAKPKKTKADPERDRLRAALSAASAEFFNVAVTI
jgi:hypothetical protein